MSDYCGVIEDEIKVFVNLFGLKHCVAFTMDIVSDIDTYVNNSLKLKSDIFLIVAHADRRDLLDLTHDALIKVNPDAKIYALFSLAVDDKEVIIFLQNPPSMHI